MPYSRDERAPKDYWLHFPAGSKSHSLGAALHSQRAAAGKRGWTPYDPYRADFRWRSGVCGDPLHGAQQHLKGGRFYYGGRIVQRYTQGALLGIGMSIVTHHNGFVEVHICDTAKCNGDISKSCFRKGGCTQLRRAYNPVCESAKSPHCGPIDRRYPGRWYLPCNSKQRWNDYRPQYATFRLPPHFYCEHCVLQWYWVAANTCNPPGVLDYFDGPNRPAWGSCSGQGGAKGGVTRIQPPCGRNRFPEEYMQCADIAIDRVPRARSARRVAPNPTPRPTPWARKSLAQLLLWADNKPLRELVNDAVIDISIYDGVLVEAVLVDAVRTPAVQFFVDGSKMNVDYRAPYFLQGKKAGMYWYDVPLNKRVRISAKANREWLTVHVTFVKR
ncbi:hypothetical protein BWQ96_08444 [Gracilariopsis chorda]|uniref:Chitin-binding type-4 domain-containing protein n=1 Tax=Gracilariopsis chorda TaxID=448386 RepID=A0A2V3II93_9FLOR|nr:hypothetical protein BWQ96_08444 [Gracilariopsis chorda]|eukprot:PXF41825.1 hypothetical protein BWQ96_08444 [Gracilariopsis chorda]